VADVRASLGPFCFGHAQPWHWFAQLGAANSFEQLFADDAKEQTNLKRVLLGGLGAPSQSQRTASLEIRKKSRVKDKVYAMRPMSHSRVFRVDPQACPQCHAAHSPPAAKSGRASREPCTGLPSCR
jgi:hypothetical protein